ncbi:MAG: hypothetical protein ACXVAN_13340 [Polyangia bacterium]
MRTLLVSILAVALAGCGGGQGGPVQGPFTGVAQRFRVTRLILPMQRSDYAVDLNDDGRVDNQLGNITGAIDGQLANNQHVDEILAADPTPMIVEIVSDDAALREDDRVGVRWLGGDGSGDQLGAILHGGALQSNPVTTTPARALVRLPLFAAADAAPLALDHYQLDLAPDGDGGFVGQLNGTVAAANLVSDFVPGLLQMMRNRPLRAFISWFDHDRDGTLTVDEVANDGLTRNLLAPDVRVGVRDNYPKDDLSVGFMFTLLPCADEACTQAAPAASCFDRVRNGDETDVDCGGGCGPCAGGDACTQPSDCATQACDGGRCRAPSCGDAIRDGFEIDIDCGPGCGACVDGAHCYEDVDCVSGKCGDVDGHSVCQPK